MKKSLSAVAVIGIAAVLALGNATSASAAAPTALPPGQSLFAIDCDDFGPQLWSVAPSGASTPVGSAPADSDCAGGGQTDPTTGISYFVYYPGGPTTSLATVNLSTGAVTTIANLSGATTDAWQFFITNAGTAYVTNNITLYSISLTTAVTTEIGDFDADIDTMGYSAVNDTIYGFSRDDVIRVYSVDRVTGGSTNLGWTGNWPVGTCLDGGSEPGRPDAVAFDAVGNAWIQSDSCYSSLMTVNMTTREASVPVQLVDSTGTRYPTAPSDFYSETFIISAAPAAVAPAAVNPALAATGVNTDAVVALAGAGGLALLLGAALMVRRRATI